MKCFTLLAPLLAALIPLASASALLPRQSTDPKLVDPRVAKCANSEPCACAASIWTECQQNAKQFPSIAEIAGGGLAECLCMPTINSTWRSNPAPKGRIFRPEWECDLLECIECMEDAFGGDHSVSTGMMDIIASATSSPLGFCVLPDEFGFRQRSRELKNAHNFPLLLPMATLPPPPTKRVLEVGAPDAAPAISTRQKLPQSSWVGPITTEVQTCLDTHACARSRDIFDWCMACIPGHENVGTNYDCLCSYNTGPNNLRPEWYGTEGTGRDGLAMQCATCLSKAVPGATDLTINLASAISTYCYNPPSSPTAHPWNRNQLLGWASNITFTYKVPVTLLNYTIAAKTPWTIPFSPDGTNWDTTHPW